MIRSSAASSTSIREHFVPDSLRGRAGKIVVIGGSELTYPPSTKNPVSSTGLPGIGAAAALAYDTEIYLTGSVGVITLIVMKL